MEAAVEQPFRILVVEDEPGIQELVRVALTRQGYVVKCTESVELAAPLLKTWTAHMIILDWMLPGESGLNWCRSLRRSPEHQHVPVMLITARGEENDRVTGLDSGADDYISKPFSPKEMVARVKALLRRAYKDEDQFLLSQGPLRLDLQSHRVFVSGTELHLGPTEFKLLQFFMSHPERVFARSALLDRIWGQQVYVEERTVDVHIRRLRKVLEPFGCENYVETVRGAGYRFRANAGMSSNA